MFNHSNRVIWIGLAIALGCGVGIEVMKGLVRPGSMSGTQAGIFGYSAFDENSPDLEHSRSAAQRARARLAQARIAGLEDGRKPVAADVPAFPGPTKSIAETDNNHVDTALKAAVDAANARNAQASLAKPEDPAKKKKKKKKTIGEKKAGGLSVTTTDAAEKNADKEVYGRSSSTSVTSSDDSVVGGRGGPAVTENLDPVTLEEWIAFITKEPNYERTLKLIEAHNTRKIESGLFHSVIAQMIADEREKMHEYALLALSSAPSVRSYLTLQTANLTLPANSQLRSQTRAYLQNYTRIENLRFLAGAISTNAHPDVMFEAMRLIQAAVELQSHGSRPNPGGPHTSSTNPSAVRQFNQLLPLLTRVVQTGSTTNLRREASETVKRIESYTSTTPTATVGANSP